jgi:hypothetical protein
MRPCAPILGEARLANAHAAIVEPRRHQGGPPPFLEQLDHDQSALEGAVDGVGEGHSRHGCDSSLAVRLAGLTWHSPLVTRTLAVSQGWYPALSTCTA